MPKTVLFLGTTGGCAFSALRRSLDAGHVCIAICRTPSKLLTMLCPGSHHNLTIIEGNAHDPSVAARALASPVDIILSSLGGAFSWARLGNDDPSVCERGMSILLAALASAPPSSGLPLIIAVSGAGASERGREVPLALVPVYAVLVAGALVDKRAMERRLQSYEGPWTVVRPSMLTDGPEAAAPVRVGVEHPATGVETREVGYTISREDVGRWMFENLVQGDAGARYEGRAVTITY